MKKIMSFLAQFDRSLALILRGLALVCFVTLLILLAGVVFVRFVPITSLGWSDEIVEWAFAWMVFIGAAALWRDNEHFRVQWLPDKLNGRASGKALGLVVEALSITFLVVMTYYGMKVTVAAHHRSPILELPRHIWYLCIPLAGMIMIAYSIRNFIGQVLEIRHSVPGGEGRERPLQKLTHGRSLQPKNEGESNHEHPYKGL
jgi:TRAP-type C4-dicarboxylate transport system permease small subunit